MADPRPARSRAGNSVDDAVRKQVDAVRKLRGATNYDAGSFTIRQAPGNLEATAAAVAQLFGTSQTRTAYPSPPASSRQPSSTAATVPTRPGGVWESAKAGVRGVVDSLPMELGNYIPAASAALGAAVENGSRIFLPAAANNETLEDPFTAFRRQLAAERGQDRYDEAIHPTARTVGKWTGTAAQLAAIPGGALAQGGRMAEAAALLAREKAILAGTGAATGVGSQGVSDWMRGRPGSVGDYVGSALGGSAAAFAAITRSPRDIGLVDGAVTSVAQDVLNGRRVDWDKARRSATDGAALAVPAGALATRWANSRSIKTKEEIGELISRARTIARGDRTLSTAKRRYPLRDGGYTYPDQRTMSGQLVESKFGRYAALSRRQSQAFRQDGLDYRVDQGLPRDFGAVAGLPFGFAGYQMGSEEDR